MHKLKLVNVGKHKIQVIKLIRMFTGLGLKESKELTDNTPSTLTAHSDTVDIDQFIKSFTAIGAVVEKVKVETTDKPKNSTIGTDEAYSTQRPGAAIHEKTKTEKKDYQKKDFEKESPSNEKLKLKPAIMFAIMIAVIKSIISIQFGFFVTSFYAIFIVAVGIAYFLRKHNINAGKNIGIAAFLITFLYFFSIIIADAILLYTFYQHVIQINIIGLFVSFFTTKNFLVIVAAGVAYFFAINKEVFRKFIDKKQEDGFVENKQLMNHKKKKRF